jgi:glutaredoxin
MDKALILYTMDGCPYCDMIKNQLKENNIDFYDRDIFKYEKEFDMFVEVVGSDYVPAFMIVEDVHGEDPKPHLFTPENDFSTIDEGVEIIKQFIL